MSLRKRVFTALWLLVCYWDLSDSKAETKTYAEVVWTPVDH